MSGVARARRFRTFGVPVARRIERPPSKPKSPSDVLSLVSVGPCRALLVAQFTLLVKARRGHLRPMEDEVALLLPKSLFLLAEEDVRRQ
jgi:hypothetical protein